VASSPARRDARAEIASSLRADAERLDELGRNLRVTNLAPILPELHTAARALQRAAAILHPLRPTPGE
jgi:hypothetical protein